jgi:hypothetical protein
MGAYVRNVPSNNTSTLPVVDLWVMDIVGTVARYAAVLFAKYRCGVVPFMSGQDDSLKYYSKYMHNCFPHA